MIESLAQNKNNLWSMGNFHNMLFHPDKMTSFLLFNAVPNGWHRIKAVRHYFRLRQRFIGRSWAANATVALRSLFRPEKTILFFPDRPGKGAVVYKLCALLGYAITTNPSSSFSVAVKYRYATTFAADELKIIPATGRQRVVNAGSLDISKHAVGRAFAEIFSYPLEVNPLEFQGQIVEKSDRNACHDGRVLAGPLAAANLRPGRVYQKAINNVLPEKGLVLDHRVPILGGTIPLAYLKYRPLETRFANVNSLVELKTPEAVFSKAELEMMVLLAKKMGVDYGEFDVLRDQDGRIYVVDINDTPHGPPAGLPEKETKAALAMLMDPFARMLARFERLPANDAGQAA
jgi:hypothetical protein